MMELVNGPCLVGTVIWADLPFFFFMALIIRNHSFQNERKALWKMCLWV